MNLEKMVMVFLARVLEFLPPPAPEIIYFPEIFGEGITERSHQSSLIDFFLFFYFWFFFFCVLKLEFTTDSDNHYI